MKKIYAAPSVVASGEVVRETKGSFSTQEIGPVGPNMAPGTVGFYL